MEAKNISPQYCRIRQQPGNQQSRNKVKALSGTGVYSHIYTHSYTGEKNLGEMGPPKEYYCDHATLRTRSWQLYLDSEICQIIFSRLNRWVIGNGLKLQSEPSKNVLESERIELDTEKFNEVTESRFSVFANSTMADYSSMSNLHTLASDAFLNSIVGGDVLVVLRLVDNQVKVQLIDGVHVGNPSNLSFSGTCYIASNGNKVKHGIELSPSGQHVAYYVRTGFNSFERIEAIGSKSGLLMAFMVYGLKYRLDNVRGIPLIAAVMETASKMDRYKEATLGSAEERAKIPYTIEHSEISDGSNPLTAQFAKAFGGEDLPVTIDGEDLANKVAATVNKQVVNMPQGAQLKSLESKAELYFGEFLDKNIMLVCATVGIPKDIAMMLYDSNYSASRAAIKDWEHTLTVRRKSFADQLYKNVYALWFTAQVLQNKIQADGYIKALSQRNIMAVEAFRSARWVGANVPHIDPLKEVMAEREKLGPAGANLPLTTLEAATESLNGGDSQSNMQQFAKELEKADGFGIDPANGNSQVAKSIQVQQ